MFAQVTLLRFVCSVVPSNLLCFWLLSFSHIFLFLLFKDSRSWANFCWSCCTFETIWWRLCCYSTWVVLLYLFQSGVYLVNTYYEKEGYYALICINMFIMREILSWMQWLLTLREFTVPSKCWIAGSGYFTAIFWQCRMVFQFFTIHKTVYDEMV